MIKHPKRRKALFLKEISLQSSPPHNGVLYGPKTGNQRLMRINLIIVRCNNYRGSKMDSLKIFITQGRFIPHLLYCVFTAFWVLLWIVPSLAANSEELIRAQILAQLIPYVEQDLENKYDDPQLHWNLAKAYAIKFMMNPASGENHLGLAFGEYITSLDLEENPMARDEFEFLYNKTRRLIGAGETPFAEFYSNAKKLYDVQRKHIRIIINVRKELDTLYKQIKEKDHLNDVDLAYNATRAHIHEVFLIATGRKLIINRDTGNNIILAAGFYKRWYKAISSYGFDGTDLAVNKSFSKRFPKDSEIIRKGQNKGLFMSGNIKHLIIPGLGFYKAQSRSSSVSQVYTQDGSIVINSPQDGARVPGQPIVEGVISDERAEVWVMVHPMVTSDYWVQPRVTIRRGGVWRVQVYIGRPGSIDVGKHFEVMAVANPKEALREGKVLGTWPYAQWRSDVIEVIRR